MPRTLAGGVAEVSVVREKNLKDGREWMLPTEVMSGHRGEESKDRSPSFLWDGGGVGGFHPPRREWEVLGGGRGLADGLPNPKGLRESSDFGFLGLIC
ncbi:MAG: hypothetical protein ACREL1_05380 [bacterium]